MLNPEELYGDPDFKFGGLSLWALSRQFPQSDDYWDGNWIYTYASAEAPGARIETQGPFLRSDEIECFLGELTRLNQNLEGRAELNCMEPDLRVEVACGSMGSVEVIVEITPDHVTQSHRIVYALDQTYLGLAMGGCRSILTKYPIRNAAAQQENRNAAEE
jgi:hypothetical protein